jgi:autotransporter-associated beta strand protein
MKQNLTMKTSQQNFSCRSLGQTIAVAMACAVVSVGTARAADWNGSVSTDWNNPANWSDGAVPAGNGAVINTTAVIATITNDVAGTPGEIVIGGWSSTGRVDHRAGTLSTQTGGWPPGWLLIGFGPVQNGTYNLADTSATGGALTGFGTGSGTLNVKDSLFMGEPFGDGTQVGTNVLNINTTGALNVSLDFICSRNAETATVNVDAGLLNVAGTFYFGDTVATTSAGTVNLGGGILRTTRLVQRGACTGMLNLNGGTLKPIISTATFLQGLTSVDIQSGGAIIDTTNLDIAIAQNMQGVGGLTKIGNGKLTLSSGYSYTGDTHVLGGTLALDAIQPASANAIKSATQH